MKQPPEKPENTALSSIFEGGLPSVLAGPAGAAISRLIGSAVDIPAAWLDGISQGIRDKTEAKSAVSKALAERAAQMAVEDPEVMQRAFDNMLAKSYRSQQNKEAVARVALQSLEAKPPSSDSDGPTEQFMTNFEQYAERASSEDLRLIFGRLLAQEIRKPNSVSAASLQFVSLLDRDTAELIQSLIPFCLKDVAIFDIMAVTLNVAQKSSLELAGFWSWEKSLTFEYDNEGKILKTPRRGNGFVAFGEAGKSIRMDIAILSNAGQELVAASEIGFDYEAMAKFAFARGANRFVSGRTTYSGDQVIVHFDNHHTKKTG